MGPVTEEERASSGAQRVLLQDYRALCKMIAALSCMVSSTADVDNMDFEITQYLE